MNIKAGTTDVTVNVVLINKTTGLHATGLTITDLDFQYCRWANTPAAKVDATALAATNTAHTDNRGIEIDATDQPGLYRVDFPDAAFAAGATGVTLTVLHADCHPAHLNISLAAVAADVTHWLGTAAATPSVAGVPEVDVTHVNGSVVSGAGTVDANVVSISGDTTAADTMELFAEALDQATGQLDSGSLANGTVTDASIAADAIVAAKINADVWAELLATTVDGVAMSKILQCLLAVIANKVAVTDNGATRTFVFRNRGDSADVLEVTGAEADGARSATGTIT